MPPVLWWSTRAVFRNIVATRRKETAVRCLTQIPDIWRHLVDPLWNCFCVFHGIFHAVNFGLWSLQSSTRSVTLANLSDIGHVCIQAWNSHVLKKRKANKCSSGWKFSTEPWNAENGFHYRLIFFDYIWNFSPAKLFVDPKRESFRPRCLALVCCWATGAKQWSRSCRRAVQILNIIYYNWDIAKCYLSDL